ncbi:DUF5694 domain-containing protein [Massilia sp. CFBP9012]|uniref:DUF5694 domain-containing protein n=1 Tax=Massilia sp. CFBP9012 TaxID=3096531 RepID=UPI002A6A6A1A|nr:DUF5694 domain-containing protein [Massilia sp. CFBP9012]MDY0974710.1 DUF5694 domain-containing protein [Massilia sp. CFBP9012]
MRLGALLISMTVCGSAAAQDYQPAFDPSRLKGPTTGPVNQIMVLGSPHLAHLPKTFQASSLAPLNERLAAWKPQAIAVEDRSGPQCDFMRHHPARYAETVKTYCRDTAAAKAATGLDVPQATAELEKLLGEWPAAPSPAQRRRLAAVFLAGGEPASAVVQWFRLPAGERRAGDGLDAALVAQLQELEASPNESVMIAARLAARLGHERVYAMDDQTASRPYADRKAAGEAIMKAWDNPANAKRKKDDEILDAGVGSAEGLLAMYRAYNSPAHVAATFEIDFGAALNEPSPQRFGRGYVGYWETRNLRMAANIRDVVGVMPGTRLLVIVGASHKGYLEAYLHQMHDVRLVDTAAVLR